MHNFCYQIEGQEKLKSWAQLNHPAIWQQAVESGKLIDASGYKPNENFLLMDQVVIQNIYLSQYLNRFLYISHVCKLLT